MKTKFFFLLLHTFTSTNQRFFYQYTRPPHFSINFWRDCDCSIWRNIQIVTTTIKTASKTVKKLKGTPPTKRAVCETCDFIYTVNCNTKRLRPISRSSIHTEESFLIWHGGCGGSGEGFPNTGLRAEGSRKGLGFGNRIFSVPPQFVLLTPVATPETR